MKFTAPNAAEVYADAKHVFQIFRNGGERFKRANWCSARCLSAS
jgi:hypothetical protein